MSFMILGYSEHRLLFTAVALVVFLLVFIVVQLAVVKYNGQPVDPPSISREPRFFGSGEPLTYVVMGDSTAVSQGGDYEQGIAVSTARHLAETHRVKFVNLAVSGSRVANVANEQVFDAITHKPDVVLISVGANDVTHLTGLGGLKSDLEKLVTKLTDTNCDIKIILTGSPDMGSIPRFPVPLRYVAGLQTNKVNRVFTQFANEKQLTFAAIAKSTGPLFRQDKTLFAVDKFHPNTKGYATWNPVLNVALSQAIASQPSHCR